MMLAVTLRGSIASRILSERQNWKVIGSTDNARCILGCHSDECIKDMVRGKSWASKNIS